MNIRGGESTQGNDSGLVRPVSAVVLTFLVSRWLYYKMGVSFDQTLLFYGWQFLDVNLLQNRLLESIYYLHSQPPLYNLWIGAMLKVFPESYRTSFQLTYLACGFVMALSLVILMIRLGVSRILATGLTIVFVASPTTVLYENWLYYTYPTTTLLCVSAVLFHHWLSKQKLLFGILYFASCACIILTRSLFQLPWLALMCMPLIFSARFNWRSIVISLAIPLLLVVGWQAKNYYHFGAFATSSWVGMNLSRNSLSRMTPEEINGLIEQGKLSEMARLPFFGEYQNYEPYLRPHSETSIPVLDDKVKTEPSSGINYNYIGYVDVSRIVLLESLYVIWLRPRDFMESVLNSLAVYLRPASDYPYLYANRERISAFDKWYNRIVFGQGLGSVGGPSIALWYLIGLGYGAVTVISWTEKKPLDLPGAATITMLWLTIVYVTVIANVFETVENHRIRFLVDPYVLVIVGVALNRFFHIIPWSSKKLGRFFEPNSKGFFSLISG